MLARAAISHSSKFQPIVALSICEAEYVAMYEAPPLPVVYINWKS